MSDETVDWRAATDKLEEVARAFAAEGAEALNRGDLRWGGLMVYNAGGLSVMVDLVRQSEGDLLMSAVDLALHMKKQLQREAGSGE